LNINFPKIHNINFPTIHNDLLLKDDNDNYIILNNSTISVYNNNVVIETPLKDDYIPFLINYQHKKSFKLHIATEQFIIIMYTFVVDELSYDSDNYTNYYKLKINIISDKLELIKDTNTYIRNIKLKKIINNIKCLKN
jgi:hypothetical protein